MATPAFLPHTALAPNAINTSLFRARGRRDGGCSRPRYHSASSRRTPRAVSTVPNSGEYERYLKSVAQVSAPPVCLQALLHVLVTSGERAVMPNERRGVHPFLIPLTRDEDSGSITGLLRWPTAPDSMELPVVRTIPGSLSLALISLSATAHVTRAHAAADASGRSDQAEAIRCAAPAAELVAGCVSRSGLPLERYLVLRVGAFPDVYSDLANYHLAKGDTSSALVTCERANTLFPGWASPHVFYARVLDRLGRADERRDAARFALQMPLWTMGEAGVVPEMGRFAGYKDPDSLPKIYERLYEDPREKDIQEGKPPEQVALDRAAFFLDWATARCMNSWDDVDIEKLAELYDAAKLPDIATFVRY